MYGDQIVLQLHLGKSKTNHFYLIHFERNQNIHLTISKNFHELLFQELQKISSHKKLLYLSCLVLTFVYQ